MNKDIFNSFPILETDRIILRNLNEKDADKVFEFNSSLEMLKYVPRDPYIKIEEGIEKTKSFIKGFEDKNAIWWAFVLKTEKSLDKLIGYGGLFDINIEVNKAELGYGLLKEYWGQGIISEVVKKIVNFGICEMDLHKVYAYIEPANIPSIKIVERLEFKKEGMLIDDVFARNKYFDMSVYALLNEENSSLLLGQKSQC